MMPPGGLSDVLFHDLRHTFASLWVMVGGDLYVLKSILGHKSVAMTQRYVHLFPACIDTWRVHPVRSVRSMCVAHFSRSVNESKKSLTSLGLGASPCHPATSRE